MPEASSHSEIPSKEQASATVRLVKMLEEAVNSGVDKRFDFLVSDHFERVKNMPEGLCELVVSHAEHIARHGDKDTHHAQLEATYRNFLVVSELDVVRHDGPRESTWAIALPATSEDKRVTETKKSVVANALVQPNRFAVVPVGDTLFITGK
jgi:hypothetical protein